VFLSADIFSVVRNSLIPPARTSVRPSVRPSVATGEQPPHAHETWYCLNSCRITELQQCWLLSDSLHGNLYAYMCEENLTIKCTFVYWQ
jgi:hypothetical protein